MFADSSIAFQWQMEFQSKETLKLFWTRSNRGLTRTYSTPRSIWWTSTTSSFTASRCPFHPNLHSVLSSAQMQTLDEIKLLGIIIISEFHWSTARDCLSKKLLLNPSSSSGWWLLSTTYFRYTLYQPPSRERAGGRSFVGYSLILQRRGLKSHKNSWALYIVSGRFCNSSTGAQKKRRKHRNLNKNLTSAQEWCANEKPSPQGWWRVVWSHKAIV